MSIGTLDNPTDWTKVKEETDCLVSSDKRIYRGGEFVGVREPMLIVALDASQTATNSVRDTIPIWWQKFRSHFWFFNSCTLYIFWRFSGNSFVNSNQYIEKLLFLQLL